MSLNAGNQLHLVFWDERKSQDYIQYWYTTKQTSASQMPYVPFPIEAAIFIETPVGDQNTVAQAPDQSSEELNRDLSSSLPASNPGAPILIAILPVLAIVSLVVLINLAKSRR
jgi:hypothetical protein